MKWRWGVGASRAEGWRSCAASLPRVRGLQPAAAAGAGGRRHNTVGARLGPAPRWAAGVGGERPGGRPRDPARNAGEARTKKDLGAGRGGAGAGGSSEGGRTLSVAEGAARRAGTWITSRRKRRWRTACVQRGRNVEVDHVLQLDRFPA